MTGESILIDNNDLCPMSAARPSRNSPSPLPSSAEQLPLPWPSFCCCRAGQPKRGSCTCCWPCQSDGGAIIQARRNRTIKCRRPPLLAQLLLSLVLLSCQINGQFNCGVDIESILRGRQTIWRDTNKSGQVSFINFPWQKRCNLCSGHTWDSLFQMPILFVCLFLFHLSFLFVGTTVPRCSIVYPPQGRELRVYHDGSYLLLGALIGIQAATTTPLQMALPNHNFNFESWNFGPGRNHWIYSA